MTPSSDVLIVGDGIIAYATAVAIARSGATCYIVGRTIPGAASTASAGLLAPSIGSAHPALHALMVASRDRYPAWVEWLTDRAGIEIVLNRSGIIDLDPADIAEGTSLTLDASALSALEPRVEHTGRAVLWRDDGYVNNVQLLTALRVAARAESRITLIDDRVVEIRPADREFSILTERGARARGRFAVVAAGAWSAGLAGLPRPLPVEPVRGQMIQLRGCPLEHALSLEDAYLVPRGECTLVGSTLELAGFEVGTTQAALDRLRAAASIAVPALATAELHSAWAGLRPMSPDAMPILGVDPELPGLVYACGHGKNGILLAPITAEYVTSLVRGQAFPLDVSPFGIGRFQ